MNATSDDEFGYDFESDDEELLIQLAAKHEPPPAKQATNARALGPAPSAARKIIAGLEASRDVKTFKDHVYRSAGPAPGLVKKTEEPLVNLWDIDQKQDLSVPAAANGTVAYPDCEHECRVVNFGDKQVVNR